MYTAYKDYVSLACDALSLGDNLPTFRSNRSDFIVWVKPRGES